MTKKKLSKRALRELAARRSEAARKAAETRAKNRRRAEREARRLARLRSEAALRGAETRRKNREAAEREARARARKKKALARSKAVSRFRGPVVPQASRAPLLERLRAFYAPPPPPSLPPPPLSTPEEIEAPFLEPEGLVPPGKFFEYDMPKTRAELFTFARTTRKWKQRAFTNLREIAGYVLADLPDPSNPRGRRTFSFYLILDVGSVYGDFTGGPFSKDYAKSLDEPFNPDDEEYEYEEAPRATIKFHWTFDRRGNILQ